MVDRGLRRRRSDTQRAREDTGSHQRGMAPDSFHAEIVGSADLAVQVKICCLRWRKRDAWVTKPSQCPGFAALGGSIGGC